MKGGGSAPEPFPWADAMALGLGRLALPPDAFWRMTPRELAAAARAFQLRGTSPLSRAGLDGLMARFPDAPPHHDRR